MSQDANLRRVSGKISRQILRFCRRRLSSGYPQFHAYELVEWVVGRVPTVAPDSPSRILRALRRAGRIDYVVVERALSLYRVTGVRG